MKSTLDSSLNELKKRECLEAFCYNFGIVGEENPILDLFSVFQKREGVCYIPLSPVAAIVVGGTFNPETSPDLSKYRATGIITQADIQKKYCLKIGTDNEIDPICTPIREIMSSPVVYGNLDMTLGQCMELIYKPESQEENIISAGKQGLKNRGEISHLPILKSEGNMANQPLIKDIEMILTTRVVGDILNYKNVNKFDITEGRF